MCVEQETGEEEEEGSQRAVEGQAAAFFTGWPFQDDEDYETSDSDEFSEEEDEAEGGGSDAAGAEVEKILEALSERRRAMPPMDKMVQEEGGDGGRCSVVLCACLEGGSDLTFPSSPSDLRIILLCRPHTLALSADSRAHHRTRARRLHACQRVLGCGAARSHSSRSAGEAERWRNHRRCRDSAASCELRAGAAHAWSEPGPLRARRSERAGGECDVQERGGGRSALCACRRRVGFRQPGSDQRVSSRGRCEGQSRTQDPGTSKATICNWKRFRIRGSASQVPLGLAAPCSSYLLGTQSAGGGCSEEP